MSPPVPAGSAVLARRVLPAALLAAALAGCGPGPEESASEPASAEPPASEAAPSRTAAPERGGGDAKAAADDASAPPAVREPVLAMSDTGPVLRLPRAMAAALEEYAPGFRPWRREEYYTEAAAHADPPEELPLFGVVGDFNGDGAPDVALQGHDDASEYFLALLSRGDAYQAVELSRRPYSPPEPGWPGRGAYLRPRAPGPVRVPPGLQAVVGPPPVLTADAFVEVFEGQAAVLFYWEDGRFEEYSAGD